MRCWGIAVILAVAFCDCRIRRKPLRPARPFPTGAVPANCAFPAIGISAPDMIRSYFHPASDGRLGRDGARCRAQAALCDRPVQRREDFARWRRVLVIVVENPTIGVISFEGNKKIKDADLTKAIQSKANGPLSREIVQSDVVNIIALYRQHGYYDVHVAPETIAAQNAGSKATQHSARIDRVNLVFEIKEGDKLAVRQIRFVGNTAFSTTKLKAVVKTGTTNVLSFLLDNDIYDADRIDSDRDLVSRFYLDHGYADVKVSSAQATTQQRKASC